MERRKKLVKKEEIILPVNDPKKRYRFSLEKYINDRRKDAVPLHKIINNVDTWARRYDGKIAKGKMVYDDDGIGIPAFREWCVVISKDEYELLLGAVDE